jgi:MFS family permease
MIRRIFNSVFGVYRGLPVPVYVTFTASLVNGAGIFVYPFLALYLTQLLGYSEARAGYFMMWASIVYIPGALIGGKLSDRFGRKRMLILSQSLVSATLGVCGWLGVSELVPNLILLYLFFDGFADPARSAINADITTTENRQASYSLGYLGHNLGYSVGPLMAGFLFYRNPSWLFWGNGLMGFLAVLLIMIFIPETKPTHEAMERTRHSDSTEKLVDGGLFKALSSRPQLLVLVVIMAFAGFSYGQTLFALPLLASVKFGQNGAEIFGSLMSLNAFVVVIGNAPIVSLLKRNHALKNICISGILFGTGYLFYAWADMEWMFYVLTIIWTLGEIVEATNVHYYITNNTPISHRGRFSAILPIIQGSGRAIAPFVGGLLITSCGLSCLWVVTALVSFLSCIAIYVLYRMTR